MNVLDEIGQEQMKPNDRISKFNVGDTVRVHFRIVEGEKERVQIFEGVVISRKGREGPQARFTVRRVVYNEGVERVFPLHSPRVEDVEVVREGHVRRAKLHYLRELSGKAARVRAKARSTAAPVAANAAVTEDPPAEPPEAAESEAGAESDSASESEETASK